MGIRMRRLLKPYDFYISKFKLSTVRALPNLTNFPNIEVLVSTSNDIHENLALEDWFYRTYDFTGKQMLMMWNSNPCVVIGRHQNPWIECNLNSMKSLGVKLARRESGGGCVYHDLGNLNCTFFTERGKYNRKENLDIICQALAKTWEDLDGNVIVNKRDDIILNNVSKISGSAAKLGGKNSYHHCTLLWNADEDKLNTCLRTNKGSITTKATASLRSSVANLKSMVGNIDNESLINAIGQEYLIRYRGSIDGHWTSVTPNERSHTGITSRISDLRSWDWIHRKTPPFSVEVTNVFTNPHRTEVRSVVHVEKGLISNIEFDSNDLLDCSDLTTYLINTPVIAVEIDKKLIEVSLLYEGNRDVKKFIECMKSFVNYLFL